MNLQSHSWGVLLAKVPVDGRQVPIQRVCQVCGQAQDMRSVAVHPLDVSPEFEDKCRGELLTVVRNPHVPRGQVFMLNPDVYGTRGCPGPGWVGRSAGRAGRPASSPGGPARPPGDAAERSGGPPPA